MPTEPIRVVLADNHPLVRAGIRTTLATEEDLLLVGEAVDGNEAQRLCMALVPDVLLLDLQMPGPRPTETVSHLHKHCPDLKVIVLTAYDDDAYVRGLVSAGAAGYVLKDEALETVVQAIRAVRQGGNWFSQSVLSILTQSSTHRGSSVEDLALGERERNLLKLLALGWDNQHIADELDLAEQTVRNYISRLYQQLGFKSRGEAIVWAKEHGLDRDTPGIKQAPHA